MKITMKQARIGANMSQDDIANKLHIHPQTYAKYEKQPEDMSIKNAALFAKIVGVDFNDIIFLESQSNKIDMVST